MKRIVLIFVLLFASPSLALADIVDALRAYNAGDYATAYGEFQRAADQGNPRAQSILGFMYHKGQGVAQNLAEAVKWYRRAADQGYAEAQHNLGLMYDEGRGVPENDAEAVKWYRRAADQGVAYAQYNLGLMYLKGRGVPKNDAEAVKWFRRAADQGYAEAQLNLGVMFAKGEGVPENYVEAYRWWILAAAAGIDLARQNLRILKPQMTPAQISEGQRLAASGEVGASVSGWNALSSSDIKSIQKALNDFGFEVGSVDGIAGRRTKSSLATFQRVKGLPVDGPSLDTLRALGVR